MAFISVMESTQINATAMTDSIDTALFPTEYAFEFSTTYSYEPPMYLGEDIISKTERWKTFLIIGCTIIGILLCLATSYLLYTHVRRKRMNSTILDTDDEGSDTNDEHINRLFEHNGPNLSVMEEPAPALEQVGGSSEDEVLLKVVSAYAPVAKAQNRPSPHIVSY